MIAQSRLLLLLVASSLVAVGYAHPDLQVYDGGNGRVSVKINEMFDEMVPTLQEIILKDSLDPLPMADYSKQLSGILGLKGSLSMTNGQLVGLSTITRGDDIILSYDKKTLTIDISLKFDILDLQYDYYLKYAIISRKGSFDGRFTTMKMRTIVSVDFDSYKIALDSVKITAIQKLDVNLEGHAFDKVVNAVMKVLVDVFKKDVVNTIETRCAATFEKALGKINGLLPKPDGQLARYIEYDFLKNVPTTFTYTLI
ncbi:uncharacterized protein LOC122401273 [Colletes gigas]|uniref:uncharacterized protein LOC122401273 n=1 Tax=Colletes gigas TaxID=935657 RepID=UPI001C9A7B40|nr:uncharacterized protein LOC122401273 [Colletes gigas]